MCLNCISELNQAFAFKQKCERSERRLRSFLEQTESIDEHIVECSSKMVEYKTAVEELSEEYKSNDLIENHSKKDDLTTNQIKIKDAITDFVAENTLKFICSHCKANFSSGRSLKLHVNSKKCMQQTYECDICKKLFIKKRYLIRHLQRMHKMANEPDNNKQKSNSRSRYGCNLCPKGNKSQN